MQTIVVTSQKGGSGKTTVTAHLAVAAEAAGHGPVVLIDTDPQQTLATWWRTREADTPKLTRVAHQDVPGRLIETERLGFAYCLIDTPPALGEQNRRLVECADLVVIPTRPSPADLWALGATLELVRAASTAHVFVVNNAKANARITLQTVAALSEHGQVLGSVVHDRVDYATAMTDGRTAPELRASSRAAKETTDLWRAVRKRLNGRREPRAKQEAI